jgi:hypothetical protein
VDSTQETGQPGWESSSYSPGDTYPELGGFVEYLYETYETVRLQKIWKNGSKSIRKVYGKRLSRLESEYRSNFRTPDVAAQFLPGGEMG